MIIECQETGKIPLQASLPGSHDHPHQSRPVPGDGGDLERLFDEGVRCAEPSVQSAGQAEGRTVPYENDLPSSLGEMNGRPGMARGSSERKVTNRLDVSVPASPKGSSLMISFTSGKVRKNTSMLVPSSPRSSLWIFSLDLLPDGDGIDLLGLEEEVAALLVARHFPEPQGFQTLPDIAHSEQVASPPY